jgi:hypothetical protein
MENPIEDWLGNSVESRLDAVVDLACRLVDHDAIETIHLVLPERPSYDALMRYRAWAAACGLSLTLMDSEVIVRPLHTGEADEVAPDAVGRQARSRIHKLGARSIVSALATGPGSGSARRLREHLRAWGTELQGMSEGTR